MARISSARCAVPVTGLRFARTGWALLGADSRVDQLRTVMQEMSLCFNVRHTASA
jgi:hypothetical protein